jgi:transporter family-2 protein
MQAIILVAIVGVIGGLAVGLQGPLTSMMSQRLGVMESVFVVHFGGAIAAALFLVVRGGGGLGQWRTLPWYVLGAGVLGLVVLSAISFTIPRLGVASTVTLVVVGQLVLSLFLDQFGLLGTEVRQIDAGRLLGVGVLLLGTWLIVR